MTARLIIEIIYGIAQLFHWRVNVNKDLKKLLASLSVAGLLGMGGAALPGGHANAASG